MSDQLVLLSDAKGVAQGDVANDADAYVKRDTDGSINVGEANVIGLVNAGETVLTQSATLTTTGTIPGTTTVQLLDATAGAFNATLPPAVSSLNQQMIFIKIDSSGNIPTIKGSGSDNITTASATANTYAGLTAKGSQAFFYCANNVSGTPQWWAGKLS